MTQFTTNAETTRTVRITTDEAALYNLVVVFTGFSSTIVVNQWSDDYTATVVFPADTYQISWSCDYPNAANTDLLTVSVDPPNDLTLEAGTNITIAEDAETNTFTISASGGGGGGTVTSVSVVTANGVSGSVATATTTPAITLTLGAITPSSVAAVGTVTGSNLSGTNTGDQTSIVGITGTKAQFDTACTDGNFLYVGDVTQYTDEMAQDAVGAMVDSTLVYVDGTPLLTRAALTGDVTAAQGSNALTLANSGVTAATYGSATQVPVIAVDAKGRITSASNTAITGFEVPLTFSTGLTRSTNTITVNTSQNIATLSNLTTNGFVKTSGGTGALSVDTNAYLTGNQTITLSGDVTGSGSTAITATIPNNTVTYAKLQDVSATSRVLCRKTAGSGDVEEGTLSELLDFIGSAAQGDLLYRGASTWARLGAGISGYYLKTQGAGANPTWAAVSGGSTVDLQIFTSSGTWTKPASASSTSVTKVILVGGGGTGGTGRRGAASSARYGGAGGGAGGRGVFEFPTSILGATESVTVGAAVTGPAGQTADSTNGTNGTAGNPSSFGTWCRVRGGLGGDGGTTTKSNGGPGGAGYPAVAQYTSGGTGGNGSLSASGGVGTAGYFAGGGGGGGGGVSASDVAQSGGAGGAFGESGTTAAGYGTSVAGGTAGTSGGNGGNGADSTANSALGGPGGGGGAGSSSANAGNGGNGGLYGGGGGGGGASLNGFTSGAGGNGAAGIVIVITHP